MAAEKGEGNSSRRALVVATVGGLLATHNATGSLALAVAILLLSGWLLAKRSGNVHPLGV
jgi:hypothetical protein